MPEILIYHHDPVEVDLATSWTGLCKSLHDSRGVNIRDASDLRVKDLFRYARPDAVITVDGQPAVSIEQTRMNPSGHNIPQRFSCLVRAAELGVPSILYYPEFSRRTYSDPNVRYLNIRVPMAQLRLSKLYGVPSLSVFWPTDPGDKLPKTGQTSHHEIAELVDAIIANISSTNFLEIPEIVSAVSKMHDVIARYATRYRTNTSVRRQMPDGISGVWAGRAEPAELDTFREERVGYDAAPYAIDPPDVVDLVATEKLLRGLAIASRSHEKWLSIEQKMMTRPFTLVLTGTANKKRDDSEHPWPGYLSLIDILYARAGNGHSPTDRAMNLVYRLPVLAKTIVERMNQSAPPTSSFIVDTFADLIVLDGGVVAGRPIRGTERAEIL